MTGPSDPEFWDAMTDQTVNVYLTAKYGLWCPACLLPSAYAIEMGRDPAQPGASLWRCADDETHRPPGEESA